MPTRGCPGCRSCTPCWIKLSSVGLLGYRVLCDAWVESAWTLPGLCVDVLLKDTYSLYMCVKGTKRGLARPRTDVLMKDRSFDI